MMDLVFRFQSKLWLRSTYSEDVELYLYLCEAISTSMSCLESARLAITEAKGKGFLPPKVIKRNERTLKLGNSVLQKT